MSPDSQQTILVNHDIADKYAPLLINRAKNDLLKLKMS